MPFTKYRVAQIQDNVATVLIHKYEKMLVEYDRYADFTWPKREQIEDKLLNAMILKEEAEKHLNKQ
jgi:hypothetical protein